MLFRSDAIGNAILSDLAAGDSLTNAQRNDVLNNFRAAQIARGNNLGDASSFDEAIALSRYGQQLKSARLQNAANFLNGRRKQDLWAGLPQPFTPVQGSAGFRLIDPQAGFKANNIASDNYKSEVQSYGYQVSNQTNPWAQGLGMAAGAMLNYAGQRAAASPSPGVTNTGMMSPSSWQFAPPTPQAPTLWV